VYKPIRTPNPPAQFHAAILGVRNLDPSSEFPGRINSWRWALRCGPNRGTKCWGESGHDRHRNTFVPLRLVWGREKKPTFCFCTIGLFGLAFFRICHQNAAAHGTANSLGGASPGSASRIRTGRRELRKQNPVSPKIPATPFHEGPAPRPYLKKDAPLTPGLQTEKIDATGKGSRANFRDKSAGRS